MIFWDYFNIMTSKQRNKWLESLKNTTVKHPQRKSDFKTESGLPIEPLYEPDPAFDYDEKLGYPGSYPFTRGIHPNMYRGRLWTMRQYAGFGDAYESNIRYKYLMQKGQTGLSVAFDLPTQMGYDSDHPLSEGEVGKVGVAIDSLLDMETLFNEIPLEKVSVSMTINATAPIILAMYIAAAKKQGADINKLNGTVQNDILKEYIARGTYIFPPRPSMKLITDLFAYCHENLPLWNTISISGYHIREAGATAVQEIAFTLANAVEYVKAALEAGLEVDEFAPRLAFFFNAHNNLLEEVAKFRAARRIWARIMKERFNAENPRSMMLRFHTQTAGSTLTAQQPLNNAIRVAVQALAAVLGGTQSLHTNSFDEAISLPTEDAVTLALRTQQVIAYESGAADVVDPLAGSYYVENLTDRMEAEVMSLMSEIDEMGGALSAVENGYFAGQIAKSAYNYQKMIESDEKIVVGLNKFAETDSIKPKRLHIDKTIEEKQTAKLKRLRSERNDDEVRRILNDISDAAQNHQPLMPLFIEGAECMATLGEMSDALRNVFGEYDRMYI
ncbi:MAG: methylmalonyl-CoA mutase family protein [candidate division Zixibacteria bacterium]|nr:methylmalonyl-CoA mutase family protein [Candidatus Tariuqbacter arcticus]